MQMYEYAVGKVIPEFIGHGDGPVFDISDSGASLIVFFASPTSNELLQFQSGQRAEFRLFEYNGILYFLSKFGDLSWMDSPYSPAISAKRPTLLLPKDGEGLTLVIQVADGSNGILHYNRQIGLNTKFSQKLIKFAAEAPDMSRQKYLREIRIAYDRYSIADMVDNSSSCRCKIGS